MGPRMKLSDERQSSGGVAVSTSSSVVSPSATRRAPASRNGRMPSATACRRSDARSGASVNLSLKAWHRQQLVQAHPSHEAGHAAIDAAHRLVGLPAAADLQGFTIASSASRMRRIGLAALLAQRPHQPLASTPSIVALIR